MPTPPEAIRGPGRYQHGSAVVEFALVLPLVLIVALGLVQVGLVVRDQLLVEAAARAEARG
jgi:Flp pilus assembly protein TadG